MKLVFLGALAIVLAVAVQPAKADNINVFGAVGFTDFVFGIPGQPPTANLGVVEGVDTSFIYNTTSQQMSDLNFNSNGPLGPFTFAGVSQLTATSANFDWTSSQAKLILDIPLFPVPDSPGIEGTTGQGTQDFRMDCLSQACEADFSGGFNMSDEHSKTVFTWLSADSPSDPASDPPAPTPEPSSLALIGVALVSIISLRKLIV